MSRRLTNVGRRGIDVSRRPTDVNWRASDVSRASTDVSPRATFPLSARFQCPRCHILKHAGASEMPVAARVMAGAKIF